MEKNRVNTHNLVKKLKNLLSDIAETQDKLILEIETLRKRLDDLELKEERRFRDLVKKILEVDNALNRKFRALGEELINLKASIKQKKRSRS